jgi:hypothetical protein
MEFKDPLLPHLPAQPSGGEEEGGAGSAVQKFCLIKMWITLKLSSNAHWKWCFSGNPLNQKVWKHFWFLKQKSVSVMQNLFRFSKWGSLNSIAVRIRVKKHLNKYELCLWNYFQIQIWIVMFNPNPHNFKFVTKLTALGWKEPLLPQSLHCTVGEGGTFFAALKIFLIKTWITLILSSKAH